MTEHGERLGAAQETLLIPSYGHAVDSREPDAVPRVTRRRGSSPRSTAPSPGFDDLPSPTGAVLRTGLFGRWVAGIPGTHPTGAVVEAGAGPGTRYERLDKGRTRWFDLGLPDAIVLRHAFSRDTPRRTAIAASVTDAGWATR